MKLSEARDWCRRAHGNQRYGEHEYGFHLDAVEAVAVRFGFTCEIIRIACQGHDVPEDCGKSREDLLGAGFPEESVDIIMAVTDEPGETREERKKKTLPKIARVRKAIIVKLCDRIANVEFGISNGNLRQVRKYKHEQAEFSRVLRDTTDTELQPLWDHLEGLFATVN